MGELLKTLFGEKDFICVHKYAEQLNITTNFLYRIESGNRAASLDLLVEMTVHFGVTLDYLVLGNEQPRDSLKEKVRLLIQFLIKWLEEL